MTINIKPFQHVHNSLQHFHSTITPYNMKEFQETNI